MIHEPKSPIPVVTPLGEGYILYIQAMGWNANDIFTVVLKEGGRVFHFRSDQVRIWANGTFDITKDEQFQTVTENLASHH